LGGGSNGSISVHNSSSMIGLAISSVSVVPMPEVNSSPRKLTAPRGLFETVSSRRLIKDRDRPILLKNSFARAAGPTREKSISQIALQAAREHRFGVRGPSPQLWSKSFSTERTRTGQSLGGSE
jgi:hypothetical protein